MIKREVLLTALEEKLLDPAYWQKLEEYSSRFMEDTMGRYLPADSHLLVAVERICTVLPEKDFGSLYALYKTWRSRIRKKPTRRDLKEARVRELGRTLFPQASE